MGLPSKAITASSIYLKRKNEIVFNATKKCSIFKNHFSSLAQNFVFKLLSSHNIFTESKVASYSGNDAVWKDLKFQLLETFPEKLLSILEKFKFIQGSWLDNLSGKLLKDWLSQPHNLFYQTQILSKKLQNCWS